jgi:hypothetical protein
MSYFAEIDGNNVVLRVVAVPDDQEHRGEEYLAQDVGLGGRWVQTSFNARIRRRFAGTGDTYDAAQDAFVPPRPEGNVVWNDELFDWAPAVATNKLIRS